MGNQQSNQLKSSQCYIQQYLKPNKHFNSEFIKQFDNSQVNELVKDLCLFQQKPQQSQGNSLAGCFIHMMQFSDDFSFQKVHHRVSSRLGTSYTHIFNIKNYKIEQQKHLCSLSRKMYISQDSYDFTLQQLINEKLSQKESFSQKEVMTILSKIGETVIWMHDNEFRNVMLDREAVAFIRDSQQQLEQSSLQSKMNRYNCKIIDQDIVQVNFYKQFLQKLIASRSSVKEQATNNIFLTLPAYLSPQLLQQATQLNYHPSSISLKSDIFTLGMLMMQLCCQEEMYFCYNIQNMTLDYESLIHRIAKIAYSNELKLLLAEMLEYDERNRIGFVSLKEKLGKMMLKPFDETRKLKRRSSSTMLRELLSCSRSSVSRQNNSRPTRKIGLSSRISTVVSRSVEKNGQESMIKDKGDGEDCAVRRSSSMVNLKCKTGSFLTSKKLALVKVDSRVKLETDAKRVMQKEASFETSQVNYSQILRNRIKTEPKLLECPPGDQQLAESKVSICKRQQVQTKLSNQETIQTQQSRTRLNAVKPFQALITDRSIQDDQIGITAFGKVDQGRQNNNPIVNRFQLKVKSQKKEQQSKPQPMSKFNHSFVKKKVINLDRINLTSSSSHKLRNSRSFSSNNLRITQTDRSQNSHNISLNKQNNSLSANKDEKVTLNNKSGAKQSAIMSQKSMMMKNNSVSSKLLIKQSEKIQTKEIDVSNKNWIMGKLKGKSNLGKKLVQSNIQQVITSKSSAAKKQSSLSKKKQVSFQCQQVQPLTQKASQRSIQSYPLTIDIHLSTSRNQSNVVYHSTTKNDTIIKRLQLTKQKRQICQFDHFNEQHSIIEETIKDQMEMVDKVMEKCALSSSRWQEDEMGEMNQKESQLSSYNFVKYPDIKEKVNVQSVSDNLAKGNQFKKKSKVIDIDLGQFPSKNIQVNRKVQFISDKQKDSSLTKRERKPSQKLQRLKQLTIYTQENTTSEQNEQVQMTSKFNSYHNGKENNMQNSNRVEIPINRQNQLKLTNEQQQKLKKRSQLHQGTSHQQNYFNIPYQHIEYVNYTTSITSNIITPSNLNQTNNKYGTEMTVGHRKEHSTLSKPFQEIQLYYMENGEPQVGSPNLGKDSQCEGVKSGMFQMNNCEELTFRLKEKTQYQDQQKSRPSYFKETFHPQAQAQAHSQLHTKKTSALQVQKLIYFQKEDGSFVMREQNPIKSIQTSSIIGKDNQKHGQRNTVQELFANSTSRFNVKQMQSLYQGCQQSLYEQKYEDCNKSQQMDSSCNSINLSEIEYTAQKGESFLFPSETEKYNKKSSTKQPKHKHISILELEQANNKSRDLNINLKNLKQPLPQPINESAQYNTYRRYLSSNQCTSRMIELDDNFVYQGEVNSEGEFEGNGMISRKDYNDGDRNVLVYTGSFVNGLYDGFGTLYEVGSAEEKILKLPNKSKRVSFGAQRLNGLNNGDKYFSLSHIPIKYEGEFSRGMESGFGTYFYENGDKFSGCIKNGKVEGYGTYHFVSNNESISGIWRNNMYTEC